MKYCLLIIAFLSCAITMQAQEKTKLSAEEQFKKDYAKRIKQSRLYGVYIPKDVADAFSQLNRLTAQSAIQKFKRAPESEAAKKLHFSLGRWIIHNWGFYGGSRLSHYIKELGVTHPDDQAKLIILSYHRYLNKQPLAIEAQVDAVLARQKKKMEERLKKATILHSETRKRAN